MNRGSMNPFAKILVLLGIGLVIAGLLWQLGSRVGPGLGKLPGDFSIERPGFRFYLPLTTCLLISAAISLAIWLFGRFFR